MFSSEGPGLFCSSVLFRANFAKAKCQWKKKKKKLTSAGLWVLWKGVYLRGEKNRSKNMLLYFFNYNFALPWPFLLPFSIGFVATAPGKQWSIWKGRFCGESMLGEKALPKWRLIFLNPSFSNLQFCQKIQRGKTLWCLFWVGFVWGMRSLYNRSTLPKIKILYWGNPSGMWDPHVLLLCPKPPSSPCPPFLSDEEQKRWGGGAVRPACSWHCADRDRYGCHGFMRHPGNF